MVCVRISEGNMSPNNALHTDGDSAARHPRR